MDAHVHLTGNVGSNVELRDNGVPVVSFRLACTPRIRKNGEWVDGPTTWLTVTCFRGLATHVAGCVRRGDPVLVSGRLRTNTWTRDGETYERTVLEATSVGHDLTWGTSAFRRAAKVNTVPVDRSDEVGEVILSAENQTPSEEEPGEDEVDGAGDAETVKSAAA